MTKLISYFFKPPFHIHSKRSPSFPPKDLHSGSISKSPSQTLHPRLSNVGSPSQALHAISSIPGSPSQALHPRVSILGSPSQALRPRLSISGYPSHILHSRLSIPGFTSQAFQPISKGDLTFSMLSSIQPRLSTCGSPFLDVHSKKLFIF